MRYVRSIALGTVYVNGVGAYFRSALIVTNPGREQFSFNSPMQIGRLPKHVRTAGSLVSTTGDYNVYDWIMWISATARAEQIVVRLSPPIDIALDLSYST